MSKKIIDIVSGIVGTIIVLLCGISFNSAFKDNLLGVLAVPLDKKIIWDAKNQSFKENVVKNDGGQLFVIANDYDKTQVVSCEIDRIKFDHAIGNNVDASNTILKNDLNNGRNDLNNFKLNALQVGSDSFLPLFLKADLREGIHNPRISTKNRSKIPDATLITHTQLYIYLFASFIAGLLAFHFFRLAHEIIFTQDKHPISTVYQETEQKHSPDGVKRRRR